MSVIKGLSGQTTPVWPSPQVTTPAAVPATVSSFPAVDTVVNIGGTATSADASYSAPSLRAASLPLWARADSDAISQRMATNQQFYAGYGSPLRGLGSALLTAGSNYAQAVYWPGAAGSDGAVSPADRLAGLQAHARNEVSLTLSLRSGTEVTLLMGYQADGMAVRFASSAALSEQEGAALSALADGFEQALAGLAGEAPALDLAGLLDYDRSQIGSLSLQLERDQGGAEALSLQLDLDARQRTLSLEGVSGKLALKLDTSQPLMLGSEAQRARAIAAYTQRFAQAADAGQADPTLLTLLQDGFAQLQASVPAHEEGGAFERLLAPRPLADHDQALLSGLSDFQLSVSQASRHSNPRRFDEVDSFAYEASQETLITGHDGADRTIAQQRRSKLSASYHQSLTGNALQLDESPASQYYTYHRVDAESESLALIRYADHKMVAASLQQQGSQHHEIYRYEHAAQTGHTQTPNQYGWVRDLLATLKPLYEKPADSDEESAGRGLVLTKVNQQVLAPPESGFMV